MEIEKRLVLKAAGEPRSEWARLALEAAERIEALKRELKAAKNQTELPKTIDAPQRTLYNLGMLPFRELEVFDAFMLDGKECDKVGIDKYLTYNEMGDAQSLETADPNLMVELVDEDKEEEDDLHYFFSTLLSMIEAMEQAGEKMTIDQLKELAITSLQMGEDS